MIAKNSFNNFKPKDPDSLESLLQMAQSMYLEIQELKEIAIELHSMRFGDGEVKESLVNEPAMMTSAEVMKRLRIDPKTLYNWRKKGKLKGSFIGGKYLYKKQDVEKLIG